MKNFLVFWILFFASVPSVMAAGGIDEATFNTVLDKIAVTYTPILAAKNWQLHVKRDWTDNTINAWPRFADGQVFETEFRGGLARLDGMTADGFALVACQVIGTGFGGAPLSEGPHAAGSAVGQGAYFATSKCLRKYFADENNVKMVGKMTIDPFVTNNCTASFARDPESIAICERSAMAGFVVAEVYRKIIRKSDVAFHTPDKSKVNKTYFSHLGPQCQLDTYFQGALCPVSHTLDFSDTDSRIGACADGKLGARPLCWFKPL